jgi:cyclopropane-fatty-acyl-phospholipid synthase
MRLPSSYKVMLQDFWTYEPDVKYDALQSIEMIDHVVSPEQANQGLAVDLYRRYFERCWKLAKPGAWFGFQAILRDRVPRDRKDLEDLKFTADVIFPGGLNPRLEELIMAIRPYWECIEMRTQRESYGKTTAEWLRRLRLHEKTIRARWGDRLYEDYERYLSTCVRAFANYWSSDVQMKLRRCD